jgi:transglutaminase-like putative cysteine protease
MRVLYSSPEKDAGTARYAVAPRLPVRLKLLDPDGTVHRIPISPDAPDAITIIGALQFVIEQFGRNPQVRAAAVAILYSRVNNDVRRNANTLYSWVISKMVYLADPDGAEYIQTPLVLLNVIKSKGFAYGDCDDHVVLLGSMLTSIGIPTRAVAVKLGNSQHYNHVVVEYSLNGEWILMDPCAKDGPVPQYRDRLVVG